MKHLEREHSMPEIKVVAPNGLGFGEGGISLKEQIKSGILTHEATERIHEILTNDLDAFKEVEATDDGCGDGRPWSKVIQLKTENDQKQIQLYKTSLMRAKVFGGGLVAASSVWRTINGMPGGNQTIGQDRQFMADQFKARNFSHGAHSDDHAQGLNSGCGAIDKYPLITSNALKYREYIYQTLEGLYGATYQDNKSAIDQTFNTYESLNESPSYFQDADGKTSMEQILEAGAIVKELSGDHVEDTIVINNIKGTTLDQQYFTQSVKNACVEEVKPQTVQAFSVDIWRGGEIADLVTSIACENNSTLNPDEVRKLAYADFLIRTLSVAGTLTAGDLPVYIRQ